MRAAERGRWLLVVALFAVAGAGIGLVLAQSLPLVSSSGSGGTFVGRVSGRDVFQTTDGIRYVVHPAQLIDAGPEQDGIPSIDAPHFESVAAANGWLSGDALVLGIVDQGVARAYPLQILVWHEIVNDEVAGRPLLVTYCPLCGSAAAYRREVDGVATAFGTSGKVYNSNLVMYDRQTGTYWRQFDGLAIVGDCAGTSLQPIDVEVVSWEQWTRAHPDSEVLSRDTGFDRDYEHDPYATYAVQEIVCFPIADRDDCLHPKTVVYGVTVGTDSAAYRESDLSTWGTIEDNVGGIRIRLTRNEDGIVQVTNASTGALLAKTRAYWFAWHAFHPESHAYVAASR